MLQERNELRWGCFGALKSRRRGGLGDRFGEWALDEQLLPTDCSSGCKFHANSESVEDARLRGERRVGMLLGGRECPGCFLPRVSKGWEFRGGSQQNIKQLNAVVPTWDLFPQLHLSLGVAGTKGTNWISAINLHELCDLNYLRFCWGKVNHLLLSVLV